jgi:hypothetical protein
MKSKVYKRKVDTPDELLARILDAATRIKVKINLDEQQAIFVHELKSVLGMTVGCSQTRGEL